MRVGLLLPGDSTHPERHAALVESAVAAEARGFDAVWLAAPPVVLAAIAARTTRLWIGALLSPLAELDPLRVAEDYATLDGISNGRVELFAGPGPLTAARVAAARAIDPPLERSRESLELLRRLWSETEVHWSGRFRPPLAGVTVEPRPVQRPHPPLWIGAGTGHAAVDLAAELGLPLLLQGAPERGLVARYRERFAGPGAQRVAVCDSVRGADASRRLAESREALGLELFLARIEPGGDAARAIEQIASLAARGAVR
jgi:alkanesulfonate monooxygenase SsuD/methylene tetrahydromethanopterin reductase-like flavin-dependent oxidoreductase (luciferase family)